MHKASISSLWMVICKNVWIPEVVTLAPRLLVPETVNEVKPVAAPSKSRLPEIASALLPPATVEPKLTVVPVKVRSPPLKVVAPV